jgi:cyanamide hydratase
LLHDIGTTPKNLRATKLSFEYYGGFLAHDIITKSGGSQDLAESVTEAIIRHQDFIEDGMITTVGQLIQLSTKLGKEPYCNYLMQTTWALMPN